MEKEWHKIISFNGSQANAFEELVCQLAMDEDNSDFMHFERVGTPDGGVECYWQLVNGEEWGWQAKFYEQLQSKEWNGIKESLFDAVETHPSLTRYFIAVPHNLSDGRRGSRTQKTIWEDYKKQWIEHWRSKGRKLELVLWNSSSLFSKLLEKANKGIEAFFFEKINLKEEKLFLHLDAAIDNLGPKYSPDLNFKIHDLPNAFDALSRNQRFQDRFKMKLDQLLRPLGSVMAASNYHEKTKPLFNPLQREYESLINHLEKIDFSPLGKIEIAPFISIINNITEHYHHLEELYEEIEEIHQSELRKKAEVENKLKEYESNYRRKTSNEISSINDLSNQSEEFLEYLKSNEIRSANEGILFLNGHPGSGKSHLLADIVLERKDANVPAILLLGEHFTNQPPQTFIQQSLIPTGSLDQYLLALESLAKTKRQRILFIIDAMNEGAGKLIWKSQITGFVRELSQYKWVGFVFSYRTTFKEVLLPDNFNPPTFTHRGFEGIEYEATKKFFEYYKIHQPAIPILNPEFSNPLFLKTFCITLNKAGITTIPEGYEGISKILQEYVIAVNKNIAERLQYNPKINIVQKAVDKLVSYQIESGETIIPYEDAFLLLEPLLKTFGIPSSFFEELFREGLLIEDYYWNYESEKYEEHGIVFNYERFNEHLKAFYLLSLIPSVNELKKALTKSGSLYKLFVADFGFTGSNAGLLNAFSIIIPEKFGVEIYQVLKIKDGYGAKRIFDSFLQSLVWRRHDSIKPGTWKYIQKFVGMSEENLIQFYNTILLLTAHPSHYYNAAFLHGFLKDRQVGERDYVWSIQIDKLWRWYESNSIKRIIDWSSSQEEKAYTKDDAVYLLGKAIVWMFTNSNRHIRDKATKGFSSLMVDRIHLLPKLIDEFKDVNDSYVLERLLAGCYGAMVHSSSLEKNEQLGQYVYDSFFLERRPPLNINTREYGKCIIEWVVAKGGSLDYNVNNLFPPFDYEFPTKFPDEAWIKSLEIEKDGPYSTRERGESRIKFSVMGWDFARYILGTNHGSSIPFTDYTIKSKEAHVKLRTELKGLKKEMYDLYVNASATYNGSDELGKKIRRGFQNQELEKHLAHFKGAIEFSENYLLEHLTQIQKKLFLQAKKFNESGFESNGYHRKRFPVKLVQHYIIKKVFDLGWKRKWFGYYDGNLDEGYRRADKPERIGKKYQWIAYYEILALLSDNYEFLSRDEYESDYKGTWQHHLRNIDPTCLIKNPTDNQQLKSWWSKGLFSNWNEDRSTWLKHFDDKPDFSSIILCTDPKGEEWYMLYDRIVWKSDIPLGKDSRSSDYKEVWVDINAYLVSKRNHSFLKAKGETHHLWLNQEAPENRDYYNLFLAEWYYGEAYHIQIMKGLEDDPYSTFSIDNRAFKIILSTEEYGFSDEYDLSGDKTRIYRPSKFLFNLLEGTTGKSDACIYDKQGNIIAMDAGVHFGAGERRLLVKRKVLDTALAKNNLELLWFFCGEKEDIGANIRYVYRMLYSGFMWFEKGQFKINYNHRLQQND